MSHRPEMTASVVREIIAPVLRECPPECGIVSITRVDVSADTSYATLYISALMKPEAALEFLRGRLRDLQHSLVKLERRKIPQLRFRLDETLEKANRIDTLLSEGYEKK